MRLPAHEITNITGSYEKSVEVWDKLQDTTSKGRKVNKLWQKPFNQHQFKLKNYACLREREAYNNKFNVLV